MFNDGPWTSENELFDILSRSRGEIYPDAFACIYNKNTKESSWNAVKSIAETKNALSFRRWIFRQSKRVLIIDNSNMKCADHSKFRYIILEDG